MIRPFTGQGKFEKGMVKMAIAAFAVVLMVSCHKDEVDTAVKEQNGIVWISGGLYLCAQQIHLDNGDTLIVSLEDVMSYRSGDRVNISYKEEGKSESCPTGLNGKIVSLKKIQ